MANETVLRRRAELLHDNIRLAAEVFVAAGIVVEQDGAGTCTDAHRGRLRRSLMIWAMRAEAWHAWADATVDQANQQLYWYWKAVGRCHPGLRVITRQRNTTLAEHWSALPGAPIHPVADLADWRPVPIQLDPAWPNPLELLKQWTITSADLDAYQYGVLVRALEIVNFSPR
jgi:hypothetical protein